MSDWPKRYDQEWCHNGPNSFDMIARNEGEYVMFEDFERLLNEAAHILLFSGLTTSKSLDETKDRFLQFLKEKSENENSNT